MKVIFTLLFFCGTFSLKAQNTTEPIEVVKEFFKAFHNQDTLKMREMAHKSVIMQSIFTDSSKVTQLITINYNDFLKTISSIPKDAGFEEKILNYKAESDALMAQVWAPYEFYYAGKLSHCGTNNFQLLKENDKWKIFYIVDTRKVESEK